MIVRPEIDEYAERHTTPPEPLLVELAEETRATLRAPKMLTGPVEGRFLELLVFASGARRVLELGTYSGYSSLSMARGLPRDGRIDTCELDERHAAVARRYIGRARSPTGSRCTSVRRSRRSLGWTARGTSSSSTPTRSTTRPTSTPCCRSWRRAG